MMNIFSAKSKTKQEKIKPLSDAPLYFVSLLQHTGQEAVPIVKIGEAVKKHQLIGEETGSFSANVHAPISGVVEDIAQHPLADGAMVTTIVIKNDFLNIEVENHNETDFDNLTAEEILLKIKTAGVVGEGGAQFPTFHKYNVEGKSIHTFIINGTECEPYLTNDYALMNESSNRLFVAINIVNKILKAENIVVTIEKQNKELLDVFSKFLAKSEYRKFSVKVLPNEYPQGGELQLIKSVTGIEIPKGSLPADFGVIVSNVGTLDAVYKAVVYNRPLTERIITVSGDALKSAGNYLVKIGTPINHILSELGLAINDKAVVLGGPMMGRAVTNLDAPITKGSSGVLTFANKKIERDNCISCGYCVDVCPMHLMPLKFAELYRKGKYNKMAKYNLVDCIECAACEYICPSNVPLMESIKEGKTKLNEHK